MSLASYLEGVLALALIIGAWAVAGWAAARAVAPTWPAATRALASSIVSLSGVVATSQALGTIGQFRPIALAIASLAAAAVVVVVARRRDETAVSRAAVSWRGMPLAGRLALVAGCLVLAQWSLSTLTAFDRGITDVDSQTYHLSHSAHFVQEHRTTGLHHASADEALAYHPANSELLHAIGMAALRSDVLSVLINLALLPLGLLAAFCVGQRFGTGPASAIGFSVLAAVPLLGARYAGSARNDYLAITFCVAAAGFALRLEQDRHPRVAAGLAGLAAGLALGTKLTVVVPVVGLTLTVLWLRRRHGGDIALYVLGAVVTGAYWYVRNLVHVGSPVPTLELGVFPSPPIRLIEEQRASIAQYLGRSQFWTDIAPQGITRFFGVAWPLVAVAVACALVGWLITVKKPDTPARGAVCGITLTAAASIGAYLFTPTTGGHLDGRPVLFVLNLRYALPGLILALVLLPALPHLRRRQGVVAAVGLVLMAAGFVSTPQLPPRAVAYAAALLTLVLAGLRLPRAQLRIALALSLAAVVLGGLTLTRRYDDTRFAQRGWPRAELLAWGRAVAPGTRVAVVGFPLQYAFAGPRFETRVDYLGHRGSDDSFTDYRTCAAWRTALRHGRYDFVVAEPESPRAQPPAAARWTATLPGARTVLRNRAGTVFDLRATTTWPDC